MAEERACLAPSCELSVYSARSLIASLVMLIAGL